MARIKNLQIASKEKGLNSGKGYSLKQLKQMKEADLLLLYEYIDKNKASGLFGGDYE